MSLTGILTIRTSVKTNRFNQIAKKVQSYIKINKILFYKALWKQIILKLINKKMITYILMIKIRMQKITKLNKMISKLLILILIKCSTSHSRIIYM